jgi:hypothetical protein
MPSSWHARCLVLAQVTACGRWSVRAGLRRAASAGCPTIRRYRLRPGHGRATSSTSASAAGHPSPGERSSRSTASRSPGRRPTGIRGPSPRRGARHLDALAAVARARLFIALRSISDASRLGIGRQPQCAWCARCHRRRCSSVRFFGIGFASCHSAFIVPYLPRARRVPASESLRRGRHRRRGPPAATV